jgi:hypothetical protein
MSRPSFDRMAHRQLGLVTGTQLLHLGWTDDQIESASGEQLLRVRRNVYRAAGAPQSREQAWLAAALAAPGSVLSHLTAASVWGFPNYPDPEGIDLVRVGTRPRLPGVIGHRTDHLPDPHRAVRHGLPVTSAARTLVDTCGRITAGQLRTAANDGLRRRVLSLPHLVRTTDEVPRSGRRAIAPIREFLETKVHGYDPGDSDPEVDLVEALVAAGS